MTVGKSTGMFSWESEQMLSFCSKTSTGSAKRIVVRGVYELSEQPLSLNQDSYREC